MIAYHRAVAYGTPEFHQAVLGIMAESSAAFDIHSVS